MRLGATVSQVMKEETILAQSGGGARRGGGGARYVVGGGGVPGCGNEAAEAVYLEKLQQQAERLKEQLQQVDRLSSEVQQKTQATVRYRLLHASTAGRLAARDAEKKEVEAELEVSRLRAASLAEALEQERRSRAEAVDVLCRLSAAVAGVFKDGGSLGGESGDEQEDVVLADEAALAASTPSTRPFTRAPLEPSP